jgi:hypothetical protein
MSTKNDLNKRSNWLIVSVALPRVACRCRENELNLQICADLFQMLRGKIAAVIRIKDLRDPTNMRGKEDAK